MLSALISKFHEVKGDGIPQVEIWGTGSPQREFLHVNNLADACFFLMLNYNDSGLVNIGVEEDIAIKDLALLIKNIIGYQGRIIHDLSNPDGRPRKLMDVSNFRKLDGAQILV